MRRSVAAQYALLIGFFILPVALMSFGPKYVPLSVEVYWALLVISLLTGVPAAVFFVLALVSNIQRTRRSVSLEYLEREHRYTAWAALFVSLTITGALATNFTPLAPVYAALVLTYALIVVPTSARQQRYRVAIVVRCTPADAFDFVTDPRNISRYYPNVELAEPVELPLHVGSIIRYRVREGSLVLEGDETVTEFAPNQRFASGATPRAQDIYTFTPVEGGTEIAYSAFSVLTVSSAILGGAISGGPAHRLVISRREEALQRIKDILEARPVVSV